MPGPWELAIIAIIALILFGRRLPEVGKSLGKGIVEFKKGLREVQDEVTKTADEIDKAADDT
ncbi:MAG TPA: twin-arginine translocase TatA/TatE family subunit, partial [Phycisphaerae bacterium]|nr:twin-arginine translocase TatA/TatE family subunit [Phycisphaerae bacterium]